MYFTIRIYNASISKEYRLETLEEVAVLQTVLKKQGILYKVTATKK